MNNPSLKRILVLWQRELREHPAALVWTPLVIAGLLTVFMSISALLANELTTVGGALFDAMIEESREGGMSISFDVSADASRQGDYQVIDESEPVDEEAWNFSREWNFDLPEDEEDAAEERPPSTHEPLYQLNPVLNILHNLFLVVLYLVSFWYLLGSLYNDRRDRSILFWKSMPVSDWEEVLAKLGIVLLVAPAIYIASSMVAQLLSFALSTVVVDESELRDTIVTNVSFGRLYLGQLQGWLLTVLWILPLYAWLLLASAGARRSPFLLAVVPVVGLILVEQLFIGSEFLATAVGSHIPHGDEDGIGGMGFYMSWPDWSAQGWLNIVLGLVFAAAALRGTVWLRRHRYEVG